MTTQEKKLEIWKDLSRQMGCPPKDSEEYFQKTEAYYHILEELNTQQDMHDQLPPPHRASQRAPADPDVRNLDMHMQRPRGVCYCDCHRTGGHETAPRPKEPMRRHKVTRCDTSDSDSDDSFRSRVSRAQRPPPQEKEKRGRGRPRKVVVSDSDSESEEEVKPKLKRKVEVPSAKNKPEPKKDTKKSSTKRASR
jgi:hypothetical protein